MKLTICVMITVLCTGCNTKYVYLKHGQKVIVFTPTEEPGRLAEIEIEAPKYHEERERE